jgi:hypothetical protein
MPWSISAPVCCMQPRSSQQMATTPFPAYTRFFLRSFTFTFTLLPPNPTQCPVPSCACVSEALPPSHPPCPAPYSLSPLLHLLTPRSSPWRQKLSPNRSVQRNPPSCGHSLRALPLTSSMRATPHHITHDCSVASVSTLVYLNTVLVNQYPYLSDVPSSTIAATILAPQVPAHHLPLWRAHARQRCRPRHKLQLPEREVLAPAQSLMEALSRISTCVRCNARTEPRYITTGIAGAVEIRKRPPNGVHPA